MGSGRQLDSVGGGVITLGEWVALRDAQGVSDPGVWSEFYDAAVKALDALKRWFRSDERAEVLSDLCKLVDGVVPRSWRRAKNAGASLSRWLIIVARRRLQRLRKAAPLCLGDSVEELPQAGAMARRGQPDSTRLCEEDAALLTPKQLAAHELRLQGLTHKEIAERTGNSSGGVKDLLRRARKHLATRTPAPPRHGRRVLVRLAELAERGGDALNATLLRLRAAGAPLRECAARLGITLDGVRGRMRRWWNLRPGAWELASDTCLPCDALQGVDGVGAAPFVGARDGVPHAPLARGRAFRPSADTRRRDPP